MAIVQNKVNTTSFRIWVSLEGLSEGERLSFPSEGYDDEYVVSVTSKKLDTIKRLNELTIGIFERNLIDYAPHMLAPVKTQTYRKNSYDPKAREQFYKFDNFLKKYERKNGKKRNNQY